MSLRAWLLLGTGGMLTFVLTGLGLPLAHNLEQRSYQEFQAKELGQAGILASEIADAVAHAAGLSEEPPHPGPQVHAAAARAARASGARVLVIDAHRRVLADSSGQDAVGTKLGLAARPELRNALQRRVDSQRRFSATLDQDLLVVAVPVIEAGNVVGAIRLSAPLGDVQRSVHRTWRNLALAGALAIAVGLALTWLLTTAVTRPLRRLQEASNQLAGGKPASRARPGGPSETAALAHSFNRMADILQSNATAQRDFLANAAHQLQTPLTSLNLLLEQIEYDGRASAEPAAAKARTEVARLSALVGDLLVLTKATSIEHGGARVDLAELGQLVAERWQETAARHDQELRHVGPAASAWINEEDAEQLLDALIDNAIRYCPAGTTITVESGDGANPLLAVADDGPGIPEEERERVFERFYRGRAGRRSGPGSGLGLAIAAELARRWDAEIVLADGAGTRVEIRFPNPSRSQRIASPASSGDQSGRTNTK